MDLNIYEKIMKDSEVNSENVERSFSSNILLIMDFLQKCLDNALISSNKYSTVIQRIATRCRKWRRAIIHTPPDRPTQCLGCDNSVWKRTG